MKIIYTCMNILTTNKYYPKIQFKNIQGNYLAPSQHIILVKKIIYLFAENKSNLSISSGLHA